MYLIFRIHRKLKSSNKIHIDLDVLIEKIYYEKFIETVLSGIFPGEFFIYTGKWTNRKREGAGWRSNEFEDYYSLKSFSTDFVPLLQLYFGKSKVKPYIFGALGIGFGKIIDDDSDFPSPIKYKVKSFIWDVGGGAALFLNDRVSIDLGLGYAYNSDHISSKSPLVFQPERTDINKGFITEIGIYVYLK